MQNHTNQANINYFFSITVIKSRLEDFKIAWILNKLISLNFVFSHSLDNFPVYFSEKAKLFLIGNQEEKNFFIKDLKEFDYIIISSDNSIFTPNTLKIIQQQQDIIFASNIPINRLKKNSLKKLSEFLIT